MRTLDGLAKMLPPFQREEPSLLSVNFDDQNVHASAGCTSHHGVPQSRADAPLSCGFRTPTEEHQETSANGFDPEHEEESSDSSEIIVAEEKIGSVLARTALTTGTFAALLSVVRSIHGDTTMVALR